MNPYNFILEQLFQLFGESTLITTTALALIFYFTSLGIVLKAKESFLESSRVIETWHNNIFLYLFSNSDGISDNQYKCDGKALIREKYYLDIVDSTPKLCVKAMEYNLSLFNAFERSRLIYQICTRLITLPSFFTMFGISLIIYMIVLIHDISVPSNSYSTDTLSLLLVIIYIWPVIIYLFKNWWLPIIIDQIERLKEIDNDISTNVSSGREANN